MSRLEPVAVVKGKIKCHVDAPESFGNDDAREDLRKRALRLGPALYPGQQATAEVVSPKKATSKRRKRGAFVVLFPDSNAQESAATDLEKAAAALPDTVPPEFKDLFLAMTKQSQEDRKQSQEDKRVLTHRIEELEEKLKEFTTSDVVRAQEYGSRCCSTCVPLALTSRCAYCQQLLLRAVQGGGRTREAVDGMVVNLAVQLMRMANKGLKTRSNSSDDIAISAAVRTLYDALSIGEHLLKCKFTAQVSNWANKPENKGITGGTDGLRSKLLKMVDDRNTDIHPKTEQQMHEAVAKLKDGGGLQGWVKEKEPLACHILLEVDKLP
jgi:hypothetical protein